MLNAKNGSFSQIEADDNETCDVGGYLASETEDLCCQSNCTLKPGAQCSNKNYPCCTEHCQVHRAILRTKIKNCYAVDIIICPP